MSLMSFVELAEQCSSPIPPSILDTYASKYSYLLA